MWLLLSALCFAQTPPETPPVEEPERPVVGLALSGGGALGLAHVGVLQAMEELRIPVDRVAGTSIGGLIGGLYASGMSADEIAEVIRSQDWGRVFVDKPDRQDLSMRRKQDDFRFVSSLTVGVEDKRLELPLGLREGHRQNLLFESLTLPVVDVQDFDQLPIPYRAIAARQDTQAEVELSSGELAQAMRATMSIPGFFAPVEVDGVLLVDGGVADNLPVDNVRDMGADLVIACWVDLPSDSEDMVSASSATLFSLLDRGSLGAIDTLGEQDVLVVLDPGSELTGGWTKGEALIEFGYAAAMAQLADRPELQLSEVDYAAWRASTRSPPVPTPTIHFIRLDNRSGYSNETLLRMLEGHEGQPFDGEAIIHDVDRIYGLGAMSWVSWSLVEEGGETGLLIEVREKPWGPNYLSFGLGVEASAGSAAALGVTLAHRRYPWNRLGGEWANELTLGQLMALRTELYQPLSPGLRPFVALGAGLERLTPLADFYFFEDIEWAQEASRYVYSETTLYLDVGVMATPSLELRAGYHLNSLFVRTAGGRNRWDEDDEPVQRGLPELDFSYGQLRFQLRHDRLDDAWFPKHGTMADVTFDTLRREIWLGEAYYLAAFSAIGEAGWWFTPRDGRHTGSLFLLGANIWPYYERTGLVGHRFGGLFRFSGYPRGSVEEDVLAFARLGYRFEALKGPVPVYLGVTGEMVQVGGWIDAYDDSPLIPYFVPAGSVYVGLPTPLGPIYLAYAVNGDLLGTPVLVIGQVL